MLKLFLRKVSEIVVLLFCVLLISCNTETPNSLNSKEETKRINVLASEGSGEATVKCGKFDVDNISQNFNEKLTSSLTQDGEGFSFIPPGNMYACDDTTLLLNNTAHGSIIKLQLSSSNIIEVYSFEDKNDQPLWINFKVGYYYIFTNNGWLYKFDEKFSPVDSIKIGKKQGRFHKANDGEMHFWFGLDNDKYVVVDTTLTVVLEKNYYPEDRRNRLNNNTFNYNSSVNCTMINNEFYFEGDIIDTMVKMGYMGSCLSPNYLYFLVLQDEEQKYKLKKVKLPRLDN